MTAAFQQILDLVDRYLDSGDFWALWHPVAGPGVDGLQIAQLTSDESACFDELYDVVYMGQPDGATALERADGLRGGAELRARIAAWRAHVDAVPRSTAVAVSEIHERLKPG